MPISSLVSDKKVGILVEVPYGTLIHFTDGVQRLDVSRRVQVHSKRTAQIICDDIVRPLSKGKVVYVCLLN